MTSENQGRGGTGSSRNQEIIDRFGDLVRLATIDEGGPSFRVRAYENALRELEEFRGELADMSVAELTRLDGIGKSTAQKIREYYDTGAISKLEELRKKYPPAFVELTRIPGLGPKSVLTLRAELGVENIDQLRAALESKKLRAIKGFGARTEANIVRALERMGGLGKNKRRSIATALPLAERLVARLAAMKEVERATYCGSLRRFRETIGDIDIVAVASDHRAVMEAFTTQDEVQDVVGQGDTKSSVIVDDGLQVDLRVVEAEQYGAAILYFTGSKAHNIKLRQRAIARAWTLNEYGLTDVESGDVVASVTEQSIYDVLDLAFIEPPMREDHGEVEAAASKTLIEVVRSEDVRGEWAIEAEHLPAVEGLEYAVVMVPADALEAGRRTEMAGDAELFWAATFDVGAEIPDAPAADLVIGRIPRGASGDLSDALVAAASDPRVRAIFGGSGRIIAEQEGASFDVERVARALAENDTVWIIDADLRHLDPSAEILRRSRDVGVTFALGSGTRVEPLASRAYGPRHCQRAWIDRRNVANCWSAGAVREWL